MASTALSALLDGAEQAARVVASTTGAVHLETEDSGTVCLATPDAVRLPDAMVCPRLPNPRPRIGAEATVGGGQVRIGNVRLRPGRWWRPDAPGLRDVGAAQAAARYAAQAAARYAAQAAARTAAWPAAGRADPVLSGTVAGPLYNAATGQPPEPAMDRAVSAGIGSLRAALTGRGTWRTAAHRLTGLGPGLTPAGDDVLVGALVALRAAGDQRVAALATAVGEALHGGAGARTTPVSVSLLRHAMAGRCVPELAGLLRALDRGDDPSDSLAALGGVGATSGRAMAAGALLALAGPEPS